MEGWLRERAQNTVCEALSADARRKEEAKRLTRPSWGGTGNAGPLGHCGERRPDLTVYKNPPWNENDMGRTDRPNATVLYPTVQNYRTIGAEGGRSITPFPPASKRTDERRATHLRYSTVVRCTTTVLQVRGLDAGGCGEILQDRHVVSLCLKRFGFKALATPVIPVGDCRFQLQFRVPTLTFASC